MSKRNIIRDINELCQHLPDAVVAHVDAAVHAILESSVTYDEMLEALRGVRHLVEYVPMTKRAIRDAREGQINA
jgi:hypothetical protein